MKNIMMMMMKMMMIIIIIVIMVLKKRIGVTHPNKVAITNKKNYKKKSHQTSS